MVNELSINIAKKYSDKALFILLSIVHGTCASSIRMGQSRLFCFLRIKSLDLAETLTAQEWNRIIYSPKYCMLFLHHVLGPTIKCRSFGGGMFLQFSFIENLNSNLRHDYEKHTIFEWVNHLISCVCTSDMTTILSELPTVEFACNGWAQQVLIKMSPFT